MTRTILIPGDRYGNLTIVRMNGPKWVLNCDCGSVIERLASKITSGFIVSCGCLKRKRIRHLRLSHGLTESVTYKTWCNMKQRCTNPKNNHFKNYGERGITVCDRWQSFENFLSDMGECPQGATIERKNNDLGYAPENCCWLPSYKQQANTTRNIYVIVNEQRVHVAEAERILGMPHRHINDKQRRLGWSAQQAVDRWGELTEFATFTGEYHH